MTRARRKNVRDFCIGTVIGFIASVLVITFLAKFIRETNEKKVFLSHANEKRTRDKDKLNKERLNKPFKANFNKLYKGKEYDEVKKLARTLRILCFVVIRPFTLNTTVKAVQDTWGKRCNTLLFMSSKNDTHSKVVHLNVPEGRINLWLKTRDAFRYVYENHLNDADWFVKADDDTFLIVENLRFFLQQYKSTDHHYFGFRYKAKRHFNSGGASYVFSKRTLKEFYALTYNYKRCYPPIHSGAEDLYVAWCLESLNILPKDTRDTLGRHRFHQLSLHDEFNYSEKQKAEQWKAKTGRECCSNNSISFHHIGSQLMYQLDYLIYDFRVYGKN